MPTHSPAPVQAVLFDYGVVLSGPPDPVAWVRMLEISGLDEAAFGAAYWAPRHDYDRGVLTGEIYWRVVGQHAGVDLTDGQVAALLEADNVLWTQVNQPMVDWALRLQAAGVKTGILSNLGDAMTAGVLARQTWLGGFDHLLWSYSVGMAKPDPGIYSVSIHGLGVDPASILFIDDRENNAIAGAEAGMQAVLYTTQEEFEAAMENLGLKDLWLVGLAGS